MARRIIIVLIIMISLIALGESQWIRLTQSGRAHAQTMKHSSASTHTATQSHKITQSPQHAEKMEHQNTETNKSEVDHKMETATFGAGCFWGVEVTFRNTPGVKDAIVGYCGGTTENPTYKEVCSGRTGHAESVQVTYDPDKVSYEALLDVFFSNHNSTTLNRQGPDIGTQYRSVIFYHSPDQEAAAKAKIDELQKAGKFGGRDIVTQIVPAAPFWKAEEYHQRYLEKRGLAVCH